MLESLLKLELIKYLMAKRLKYQGLRLADKARNKKGDRTLVVPPPRALINSLLY